MFYKKISIYFLILICFINSTYATEKIKETTYGIGIYGLEITNLDFSITDKQTFTLYFGFNPELFLDESLKNYVSKYDVTNFRIENITTGQMFQTNTYQFVSKNLILTFPLTEKFLGNKNGIQHIQVTTMIDNVLNYQSILQVTPKTDFYIEVKGLGKSKENKNGVTKNTAKSIKKQIPLKKTKVVTTGKTSSKK